MNKQDKAEKVYDIFQSIATEYDAMNEIISLKRHQSWKRCVVKKFKGRSGNFLDLCCGTGDLTLMLSNSSREVFGIDFSEKMLEVAQKRLGKSSEGVKFQQGDVTTLPFEDNYFQGITISFGLRNVAQEMRVLQEVYRVLEPNGMFIILEASYPQNPWIKPFFKLYFKFWMPWVSKFFVVNTKAYRWLHDSTERFYTPKELANCLTEVGFKVTQMKLLFLGAATIHIAQKN